MKPADLDAVIKDIQGHYASTRNALDHLPNGRLKSLAITSLEESFHRAIFAVGGIEDPIRGNKRGGQ